MIELCEFDKLLIWKLRLILVQKYQNQNAAAFLITKLGNAFLQNALGFITRQGKTIANSRCYY